MLQYDLTETKLFHSDDRFRVPNEAELFAITVALLLVYEAAYTDLQNGEVSLNRSNLGDVAECIEQRVPEFARDFGAPTTIRQRLEQLLGLRIACPGAPDVLQSTGNT